MRRLQPRRALAEDDCPDFRYTGAIWIRWVYLRT